MNKDVLEDIKDAQEIANQKREQQIYSGDMGTWEFGKGIHKGKDSMPTVRNKIQQEG